MILLDCAEELNIHFTKDGKVAQWAQNMILNLRVRQLKILIMKIVTTTVKAELKFYSFKCRDLRFGIRL